MYIITTLQTQSHVQEKFIKVEPGSRSPFLSSTSLWSSAMKTREATHPTVTGIGHLIRKCLCPSTCVHLVTSGIFAYTGVTVDNSHQGGWLPISLWRLAYSICHMYESSRHTQGLWQQSWPLINIYIRGLNPLHRWSWGVCDNYLRLYNRVFESGSK